MLQQPTNDSTVLQPTRISNDSTDQLPTFHLSRKLFVRGGSVNDDELQSRYVRIRTFTTESGETINNLKLRYEHVGYKGQPLVVVCHALTGNHLTYGTDEKHGWWREIIDGGYIPRHDYQFLTFNVIGSPFGSSSKLNDPNFPQHLTLRDIVKAIEKGIKALGFEKINILIGASLGGMQAMELLYNNQFQIDKAIILAATGKTSSYSRAFNEIARQAIHLGGRKV